MAAVAVEMNKPYIGFCHTEKHCLLLYERLLHMTLKAMAQEGNPIYTPHYVQAMHGKKQLLGQPIVTVSSPAAADKDKKKKRTKEHKRAQKKHKRSASSSSSPPSEGQSESSAA